MAEVATNSPDSIDAIDTKIAELLKFCNEWELKHGDKVCDDPNILYEQLTYELSILLLDELEKELENFSEDNSDGNI